MWRGDGTSSAEPARMHMNAAPSNRSIWQRGLTAMLRIVLLFGATVVLIGTLLLGLVLAVGIVLWALLRGRRPGPVNLRWASRPRYCGFGRPVNGDIAGEVVDVQAQEVQGPPLR
jgi:hypothetical protein